jgi:predicted nucleotidyltransferase
VKIANALDPVLGSPTRVRLLRTLFSLPARRWTGRELARAASASTAQAARELRELSDVGIVRWDVIGRSYSWELSPDHVLFTPLANLFTVEANLKSELVRQVAEELESVPIRRAKLFGSIARGDEQSDSDVDLFLEIKDASRALQVSEALDRVRARIWKGFGNPVVPLVYTSSKVKRPPNPSLLSAIERDGIDIAPPIEETNGAD